MQTFAILRRSAWKTPQDLQAAAARSARVGREEMSKDVRWIRSYVINCDDNQLGTICIYQAASAEAIRDHARRADLKVDEIFPIVETVIVNEDPKPGGAA